MSVTGAPRRRDAVSKAKTASSKKAAPRARKTSARAKAAKKTTKPATKKATKKVATKPAKAAKKARKKAATKAAKKASKKVAKKSTKPASKAKKAPAKAKKVATKAKKAVAKKAAPKKAAPKKTAAKKTVAKTKAKRPSAAPAAKKAPAKKVAAKKAPAKKVAAKKVGAKKPTRKPATKAAAKRAPRAGSVVLAPRSSASAAPSIPLPVKKVKRRPTLEQRAKVVEQRIGKQSHDFRSRYNENFEMSWIYHDTALEGVVYTYEELTTAFRSDEVTVVDSSVMPIYDAIRRHKEAIQFIQEQAEKKPRTIGVDLLKRIYVILHPEEGDAKSIKYRRDIPQHRLYFHEYAAPDKIAYRVRQVMDWVNSPDTKRNVAPLRIAAKAHFDLARSYPFAQDSGKVARLFMNLLLLRSGMPAAIIHATERQRYYEALKSGNASMLVNMLRDSVENAVSSIEKLLDEHETKVRGFVS
jgi:chemotaxis protein histidine kinase CheA